jgi:hypothetical protein
MEWVDLECLSERNDLFYNYVNKKYVECMI